MIIRKFIRLLVKTCQVNYALNLLKTDTAIGFMNSEQEWNK